MADLLEVPKTGKYKIEIHFSKDRTTAGPNVSATTVFKSKGQLNGEGDELLYFCLEHDSGLRLNTMDSKAEDGPIVKGTQGCGAILDSSCLRGGLARCPQCNAFIKASALTSTIFRKVSTTKLAETTAALFRKLDSSADIYIKYHPTDIRYTTMEKAYGLDRARELRGLTIYPLKNILGDIFSGSSLENRFEALFRA